MSTVRVHPSEGALLFSPGPVRAIATLVVAHDAPPGGAAGGAPLAAFKVKTTSHSRFAVSPTCGWLRPHEATAVLLRATADASAAAAAAVAAAAATSADGGGATAAAIATGDQFRVETLLLRDADELRAFALAQLQPSAASPLAAAAAAATATAASVADKFDAAALWRFLAPERIASVVLPAAFSRAPAAVVAAAAGAAAPLSARGGAAKGYGAGDAAFSLSLSPHPPSLALAAPAPGRLARGQGAIPFGAGLGWRRGPIVGRGAFGLVHEGVLTGVPPPVGASGAGAGAGAGSGAGTGPGGEPLRAGTPVALKEVPLATPQAWPSVVREAAALAACAGHANVPRLLALRRLPPSAASPLDRALLVME